MSLKARGRNRLILLVVIFVAVVGAGGGAIYFRHLKNEQAYKHIRARGMDAVAAGNDVEVVNELGIYLRRFPDDIDAMAAYAHARPKVHEANGTELADTRRVLINLLRLAPNRIDERRQLMMLYYQFAMMTEANDQAQTLLAQVPNDPQATDVSIDAMIALHRLDDAQTLALARLKIAPDDWAVQKDELEILSQTGHNALEITQAATKATLGHDSEQGALLVRAVGCELTDDLVGARTALAAAAKAPIKDKSIASNLINFLDAMSMHGESMYVLTELAALGDPNIERALLRRLWEDGRFTEVLTLATGQYSSDFDDSDAQGMYADALRRTGNDSKAAAIRANLAKRHDDPIAFAWLQIEAEQMTPGKDTWQAARDACSAASQKSPRNAAMVYFQAYSEAALGETSTAIELWGAAGQLSRTWATPMVDQADALLQQGRLDPALRAVQQAYRRAPGSEVVAITLAKVWFAQVQSGQTALAANLNNLIDQIQKYAPGEEQTLEMRVWLLASAGEKDKAADALRTLLAKDPPPSQTTLLNLANISRQWKLGLDQQCLAALENKFGRSPESAYSQAIDDYHNGKGDDGLKLLQASAASATGRDVARFQLALASYLEATHDPAALAAWTALGDKYSDELPLQRAILASKVAYTDRAFFDRTISRVRALAGDQSATWKLARARWIMDGPAPDKAAIAQEALSAMPFLQDVLKNDPDSIPANLLMSYAKARSGDITGATAQLQAAQRLDPKSPDVAMDMAQLLQSRGDFDAARQELDQAAQDTSTTTQQKLQTATLMATQGDVQGAIALLEPIAAGPQASRSVKLFLASCYCRVKQFDRAQAICDELLKEPDASTIRLAAQLDMFRRDPAGADKMLAKLGDIPMPPGQLQLMLGDFYYTFDDINQAAAYYTTATQNAPDNIAGWLSLIDCQAALGKTAGLLATVSQALQHATGDSRDKLLALQRQADLLSHAGNSRTETQLLAMVVKDPNPADPAVTTLRAIEDTQSSDAAPEDILRKLQALSDSLPRFWPAQTALTEAQLRYGRCEDAVQSANREVSAFPLDPWPAELATDALISVGRWDDALRMAHVWRDRLIGDAMAADLQIAQIQLFMGDAPGAIATVQPYTNAPQVDPSQKWSVLFIQARALLHENKPQEAAALLWPVVQSTPSLRPTWITFASGYLPQPLAEQWLKQLQTQLESEPGSEPTQVLLAQAWNLLAQRTGDKDYAVIARQMVDRLAQVPATSAQAIFSRGMFSEESGDVASAQADYRAALAKADIPEARNNLAMILATHGGDLNEAADLARQCIKSQPKATFYDTLADILGIQKKYDQAIDAMQSAMRLEPDNAKWHVNMAKLLIADGKPDQARALVAELDLMTPGVRSLNDAYRHQLDIVRRQLSGAAASAAH